ncbi:MAG: hypothetical protein GQ574_04000 [Crocinitomix sp.]|nr:hypothetical protein [Crocinitomix sp.]
MKNKLLLGIGFMIITIVPLTISSCKKQYRCDCDEYINDVPTNSGGSTNGYKSKEWEADHRCRILEHSHYSGYNDTIVTSWKCTLTEE